jgi:hypothetical protein
MAVPALAVPTLVVTATAVPALTKKGWIAWNVRPGMDPLLGEQTLLKGCSESHLTDSWDSNHPPSDSRFGGFCFYTQALHTAQFSNTPKISLFFQIFALRNFQRGDKKINVHLFCPTTKTRK